LRHLLAKILVSALCLPPFYVLAARPARAQQGDATSYVYDEVGRLRAVLTPAGEAAVYEYDAAGNLKAVRRLTPNELELLGFTPRQGPAGTAVTIYGTGFNQGVNSVAFNGAPATVVASGPVSVVALVPEGATTGPITVFTPRGAATSTSPFVVRGVLLTPQVVTLSALDGLQFGLVVSGTQTGQVVWTVDGIEGGNASVGFITAGGFYTAPNLSGAAAAQHAVRATSVEDPAMFAEAAVTVLPFGAGFQFRSAAVSARYGTPPDSVPAYAGGAVSVRYGTPPNTPPVYVDGAVSVRHGTPANAPPAEISGAVSASRGPVLTSLSPGAVTRGTSVTLTLGGVALGGASGLSLFNLSSGAPAGGVTVSNIIVNGQGTSLTATLAVAAGAAAGRYAVVVTTPAGSTVRNDTGSNVVQIN
jgi:YD repeat-containing protein